MNFYKEACRLAEARFHRELFLGRGKHTGRLYFARPEDFLATHMHLIGASNFGKSFYLEHLLRAFIELGIAASLIDPHGDRARSYLRFLQRKSRLVRERRILHLAPGSSSSELGFNPFACGLSDPGEVASLLLEALILRVFGGESLNSTPLLERVFRVKFHVFAANHLPLTEAGHFLAAENRAFRQNLLARVADEQVRLNWQEIERLPLSEKRQVLASSWNRLQRLLGFPAVRRFFAAEHGSLNFADLFAKKQVLVADLSGLPSKESQDLIGTVLVNALYNAAKHRPEWKRPVHFVGIDEFPQFVTADIARSLDELRKFGIRLVLSHQRLSQLSDDLRGAVLTNARIRAVFGGPHEDAQLLSREMFPDEVRGDRMKYRNFQTKFRPILIQKEVESFSDSESTSQGDSSNSQDSSSYGYGDSQGSAWHGGDETLHFALNSSHGSGRSSSAGHSSSYASASGHTRSYPWVTEHEEFQEESTPTYWSLDEQWHALTTRIMTLDKREALVKIFNRPVLDIATPDLKQYPPLPRARRRHKTTKEELAGPIEGTILPPQSEGELSEDFHE